MGQGNRKVWANLSALLAFLNGMALQDVTRSGGGEGILFVVLHNFWSISQFLVYHNFCGITQFKELPPPPPPPCSDLIFCYSDLQYQCCPISEKRWVLNLHYKPGTGFRWEKSQVMWRCLQGSNQASSFLTGQSYTTSQHQCSCSNGPPPPLWQWRPDASLR